MKTYSIILLVAVLALTLGGCSSAYRTAQTPDAVYYSPAQENTGDYSSSGNTLAVTQGDDQDGNQYVTYDDGNNADNSYTNSSYTDDYDGYYSQRINMFDRPGSYLAYNNYFMSSPWSLNSPFAMGMGMGWDPYMLSYSSLSLGLAFGSPWGGWYRPLYAYSPYYPGYLGGGYYGGYYGSYGYYGGGYGYGYGKNVILNPRPATSYGPRRAVNSRAVNSGSGSNIINSGGSVNAPQRVFRNGNTNTGNIQNTTGTATHSRRIFKPNPSEHPVNVNTNTRVVEQKPRIRIFRKSNSTERNTYRPSREIRTTKPARTFETPRVERSTPTINTNSESHSAPVRTFSPRRR